MRFMCLFAALALPVSAAATPLPSSADPVLYWQSVLLDSFRQANTPPPAASRVQAMVGVAVADAVNAAAGGRMTYYLGKPVQQWGGDQRAAAAAAAYAVLASLYPNQAAALDAALTDQLALVPDGRAKARGLAMGAAAAAATIAARANDGSNAVVTYDAAPGPGVWEPTPDNGYKPALLPQWGAVTPWTGVNVASFDPGPPPALDSAEYAAAFNAVKEKGAKYSSTRTADETELAFFWADQSAGGWSVPGHWTQIAIEQSEAKGLSTLQNAQLFGRLGTGLADAAITTWAVKYDYNFWRPITGIRNGDTDGNDLTAGDPNWEPLLFSPPFPAYISGHATFGGVAAEVLTGTFGTYHFCSTAEEAPLQGIYSFTNPTRCWNSFEQAAAENSYSRELLGVHWSFDDIRGEANGVTIGRATMASQFANVPAPGMMALFGLGLSVLAARRRRA